MVSSLLVECFSGKHVMQSNPSKQVRKTPLYENLNVLAVDGTLIFRTNRNKLQWYLDNALARVVDEKTIQLTFVNCGDGWKDDEFYLQDRKNECAVCGDSQSGLTRGHVVPYCYRRWYPIELKSNCHHDIVPMCVKCHCRYDGFELQLKRKLSEEYLAPISGIQSNKDFFNRKMKLRADARVILREGHLIPADKRVIMLGRIREVFGDASLSDVANIHLQCSVITHGQIVVSKLNDIDAFNRLWRQWFVDTMKPKHMPKHWSIDRIGL
jgi:hypothetical protein